MSKIHYISYFDQIDAARVKILMAICIDIIKNERPDSLYFLFSSPGGQVQAGVTLYNFLRALPTKIIMHNIGSIDSIATAIFLAGEERYASASSSFLFHGVAMGLPNGASLSLGQLKEQTSSLFEDENKIAKIITQQSDLTDKEVRQLFLQGESKDPVFAKSKNFIQEIRDAKVPNGTPMTAINIG